MKELEFRPTKVGFMAWSCKVKMPGKPNRYYEVRAWTRLGSIRKAEKAHADLLASYTYQSGLSKQGKTIVKSLSENGLCVECNSDDWATFLDSQGGIISSCKRCGSKNLVAVIERRQEYRERLDRAAGIPDEAVEAALDAMLPDQNWRSHGEEADNWRNDMRLALTAAEQVRIGEEMERNFYTDIEEARTQPCVHEDCACRIGTGHGYKAHPTGQNPILIYPCRMETGENMATKQEATEDEEFLSKLDDQTEPGVATAIATLEVAEKYYFAAVASTTAPSAPVIVRSNSSAGPDEPKLRDPVANIPDEAVEAVWNELKLITHIDKVIPDDARAIVKAAAPIIRQQAARDRITVELGDSDLRDEIEEAGVELATKYDIEITALRSPGKGPTLDSIRQQALAEAEARVRERFGTATMASPEFQDGFQSGLEEALAAIAGVDDE